MFTWITKLFTVTEERTKTRKRHNHLSLKNKMELISKYKSGVTPKNLAHEYDISRNTVYKLIKKYV